MAAADTLSNNAIVTCSDDSSVRVWTIDNENPAELKELLAFPDIRNDLTWVSLSFDSKLLACSSATKLYVWDLINNKLAWELDCGSRWNKPIRFSKVDYRLLSNRPHDLLVWDGENGKLLTRIMQEKVFSAYFCGEDDSRIMAVVSNKVLTFDIATKKEIFSFETNAEDVDNVWFDPKGLQVLTGSKREHLKLWNVADGSLAKEIAIESRAVTNIVMNNDGTRLVALIPNSANLKLWDCVANALVADFSIGKPPVAATFSPTGNISVATQDGYVVNVDGATGTPIANWKVHTARCAHVCHAEPVAILM